MGNDGEADPADALDAQTEGTHDHHDLAAIVPKPAVDRTLDELREEGVYDRSRRVREADEDHVAIPVTRSPTNAAVREVVRQADPEPRTRGLDDLLRERGWSEVERDRAPKSWAVVGSVVLATFADCPREDEVGEALLELHGEADTVLATEGIYGPLREPEVRVVAGAGDTETIHAEHGTRYALDLERVMFSPGNEAERVRMGEVVEPGERVFDMFAGIGYFALPMARAGAHVTATEVNPVAFRYLLENAVLNGVEDRIDAFRADCREVSVEADRVVMGYYEAHEYLDAALRAVRPGGVVHVHAATPESLLWERPIDRLERAAAAAGVGVEVVDRRRVKGHSEGVTHVVLDVAVDGA